jgi:hypothetical protein
LFGEVDASDFGMTCPRSSDFSRLEQALCAGVSLSALEEITLTPSLVSVTAVVI